MTLKKVVKWELIAFYQISFLCGNNSSFVDALWGIWRWGHVAVPLSKTQPTQSLEYYVKDSDSTAVITTRDLVVKVSCFRYHFESCSSKKVIRRKVLFKIMWKIVFLLLLKCNLDIGNIIDFERDELIAGILNVF